MPRRAGARGQELAGEGGVAAEAAQEVIPALPRGILGHAVDSRAWKTARDLQAGADFGELALLLLQVALGGLGRREGGQRIRIEAWKKSAAEEARVAHACPSDDSTIMMCDPAHQVVALVVVRTR